jgi:phosphoribosylformimino-5-aminoimidazole carboxamide ribotide isomerase
MLIPAIDLQGARIVQLVQGERLAIETSDVDGWIRKFAGYPRVQLIDLDAAKGEGGNEPLVTRICAELPCQVGGGIRSVERAQALLALGARRVIVGSALFRDGKVDVAFAATLSAALGADRIVAAVDSRGGKVVVHGWRTRLPLAATDAIGALEPYVGGFLYTHVDREGLMQGTDLAAIRAVRAATARAVTAAGGITTMEEVDYLHSIGVDAVVGMAVYSGKLKLGTRNAERRTPSSERGTGSPENG